MARTQAADYEDRREAILQRAAELFASQGFLGTSVMDIARACNASKSLLYHYFPSKEDVLLGVMSSHIDRLIEHLDAVQDQSCSGLERLSRLLALFMEDYVGAASSQSVLLNELDNLTTDARSEIVTKQRRIVDAVQAWLIQIHPSLAQNLPKARAFTMLLFGMINWTGNWYNPNGPITPNQIAAMVFQLVSQDIDLGV